MEDFPPTAFARQRRMKLVATCFFVLAIVAVLAPVIVGLIGHNVASLTVLIAPVLLIIGVIIRTRSDPAYARM